jgi:N-acetylmuramoyl-L-alanine amidase
MSREYLNNHQRLVNKLSFLPLMGLATIVVVQSGTKPISPSATLSNWRFDPATNQLEITLEAQTTPNYFLLEQPLRIVVDLPNTQLGKVTTQQDYSGVVRQVRVSQFDKNVTRIVLELAPGTVLNTGQMVQLQRTALPSAQGDRWVLRPQIAPQTPALPTTLPPATPPSPQQPIVSVPPLPSSTTTIPIIEFGQPLPTTTPSQTTTSSSSTVVPATNTPNATILSRQSSDVLLLAGTRLNLRYAGESPLPLIAGVPQQTEMVLAEDIRNRNLNAQSVVIDNLIAPAGTAIMGQFETDDRGSRFITQAITLQGQNLPLIAQSGVLDAADKGAATNSATIEPGEIVQIRLTQDLLKL